MKLKTTLVLILFATFTNGFASNEKNEQNTLKYESGKLYRVKEDLPIVLQRRNPHSNVPLVQIRRGHVIKLVTPSGTHITIPLFLEEHSGNFWNACYPTEKKPTYWELEGIIPGQEEGFNPMFDMRYVNPGKVGTRVNENWLEPLSEEEAKIIAKNIQEEED